MEPCFQVSAIAVAIHDQIEFDVCWRAGYAQAATSEIRTPDDRMFPAAVINMIHFSMDKICIDN